MSAGAAAAASYVATHKDFAIQPYAYPFLIILFITAIICVIGLIIIAYNQSKKEVN